MVKAGDTVLGIAKRCGVTVDDIVGANNLETTASLKIGQQLVIPASAPAPLPFPQLLPHPIYADQALAPGYNMEMDTSHGDRGWVADVDGYMCMVYPDGRDWGVVSITVVESPAQDLSGYRMLSLELRGEVGGEQVWIGIKDKDDPDDRSEAKYLVPGLPPDWQTFTFPLSDFDTADLTQLHVVTEFVFEPGTPAQTVCFRNVQYLP